MVGQRSGGGGFFSGREEWGRLLEGRVGSAQLVVIRRTCPKVSPRSGRGGVAQGRVKSAGVPGAGVGRVRFEEGVQGWRNLCLLVLFSRRRTRLSVL